MLRFFLTVALAAPLILISAAAQVVPGSIIDRSRSDRAGTHPGRAPKLAAPAPQNKLAQVQPFQLVGVKIQGTSLEPAALETATKPFVGKTVDGAAIGAIAKAVADAYAGHGDIALYTVSVPDQDFVGGVLLLTVTEGYIEHVDVHGDVDGDVSRIVAMADKLTHERPLKRSTLQRYLSLIRDLPGLTLDAQLLAGDAAGAVKLSLGIKRKDHTLSIGVADNGNPLLGRYQAVADLDLFDLLREGEDTQLSIGTSTKFSSYQYYGFSHSELLDDEGTRGTLSYGYLHTKFGSLSVSGTAQTLQLAVAHPLIRSFDENLTLATSLDGIDSTNALLGLLISNEHTRAARLSAGYSLTDPEWSLTLNANAGFGLDVLAANSGTGDTDFKKLILQGQYNHLVGEKWVVRLKAVTQFAFDRLPVSELYTLGGPDYGRAFLTASLFGDTAAAGSLEVGYDPKGLPDPLTGLEIFSFVDGGSTWYYRRPLTAPLDTNLASTGVGIRIPIGAKTHLELTAANAFAGQAPGTRAGSWRFLFGITGTY